MYWPYNRTSTAFDGVKSDISIFLDLSKASNTEGRAILFKKLENSVTSCSALDWVKKIQPDFSMYNLMSDLRITHLWSLI